MTDNTSLTRFTGGGIAGRQARLPGPLRDLHRAVLRRFLETGSAPTARWVRQASSELGLDRADRRIQRRDHAELVAQLGDGRQARVRRQRRIRRADPRLLP
jgi:hypothetical protein